MITIQTGKLAVNYSVYQLSYRQKNLQKKLKTSEQQISSELIYSCYN